MKSSDPETQHFTENADQIIIRGDWRFLLPNPDPENTLCMVDGILARTVESFIPTVIYNDLDSSSDTYDLVVLKNPDKKELEVANSILKPGGSSYTEWDMKIFSTPRSITENLIQAGFETIELYMPKPNPDVMPPGIWIPLDSYGAVNYLLNSYYKSQSTLRHVGKIFLRAFWSLYPGIFFKFPWLIGSGQNKYKMCSIAQKPVQLISESRPNLYKDGLIEIDRLLHNNNNNTPGEKLSTMIISGGKQKLNKAVLLLFNRRSLKPSFILKIPRTLYSESTLKNEANILRTLMKEYNFTNGIPQVLHDDSRLGFFSISETYLDGAFLGEINDKSKLLLYAKELTHWLIKFARTTSTPPPVNWRSTHLNPLIELISKTNPISTDDTNHLDKVVNYFSTLKIPSMVCEHRDFAPWNLLVLEDGQFGILDWESSRFNGIPGLDLIYFFTYTGFYIEEAWTTDKALECYKKMLRGSGDIGVLYRECFNLYAKELGLSPQSYKPLRIITWATHLNSLSRLIEDEKLFFQELFINTRSLFVRLIEFELSSL